MTSTLKTLSSSRGETVVQRMMLVAWRQVHPHSQMQKQLVIVRGCCYLHSSQRCDLRHEVHVEHSAPVRQDVVRLESRSLRSLERTPVGLPCSHRLTQAGDDVVVVVVVVVQPVGHEFVHQVHHVMCCSRSVGIRFHLGRRIPQVGVGNSLSLRRIRMVKMDWSVTQSCGQRRWHRRSIAEWHIQCRKVHRTAAGQGREAPRRERSRQVVSRG